jgi:hypothetical protein
MEVKMGKRDGLTKFLAIAGTVLIWLPLLAPVFFGAIRLIQSGRFHFDYLMPFELFPVELLGGILLIWAAFRAKSQKKLIGWSFVAAILLLAGFSALAVVTGLSSGESEATGLNWGLTLALIILSLLGLVTTGIGGILLIKDLYKSGIVKAEDPQVPQG